MSLGNAYESPSYSMPVANADEWERTVFWRRTYTHLAGAVAAFILLEMIIFTVVSEAAMMNMLATMAMNRWSWFIVLGAFIGVSWVAESWANSSTSRSMQYAGLSLFVVAEAVIFVPLLAMASRFEGAIPAAGLMTGVIFAGLTLMVFTTRADFSWMGRYLCIAAMGALGFIVCSLVIGFSFGILFTSFMIVLACGYILYYTSNVMHHYRSDQYVAASLALFSSVALLFWYILQLVMSLSRD